MQQRKQLWVYALVGMLITICTVGFGRMAYGLLMPFMRESLELSYQQAGMLATSTALGYLVMVLVVGNMASRWQSKPLVIIGLGLLSIGSVLLFIADSYGFSIVGMVILGVGTAFSYTPLVNILVRWFPNNRGLMIGFLMGGLGLGTLITSVLIPIFNDLFQSDGWRYMWLLFAFVTFVMSLVTLKIIKEPPQMQHENKKKSNSVVKEVYLEKRVLLVALVYSLIGFAYLIPQNFYFSYILDEGLSETKASNIMALGGIISIFSGPIWGNISDKIGRKHALGFSLLIGALSMLLPVLLPNFFIFLLGQLLWGFTYVGMLSLIQALSTEQTHPIFAPVALGYVTIFFANGQMFGPGLAGFLSDRFGNVSVALWLTVGLLTLAIVLSTRLTTRQQALETASVSAVSAEK